MYPQYRPFFFIIILIVLFSCTTQQHKTERTVKSEMVMDFDIPEEQKKIISVHKFEDRSIGTDKFSPWEMGIPDMIMRALSAFPYYTVISREYTQQQILDEQKFQLLGYTDESSGVEIGKILDAQYVITGSFSVVEDFLQVNSQCISIETGEIVGTAQGHGELSRFYTIQNALAIELSNNMNLSISEEAAEELKERADTRVVEASLANYEGEEKLEEIAILEDSGEKEKAEEAKEKAKADFQRALELDKNYEKARQNLSRLAMAIPMTL